jgi:L-ascorbate metabolism protein UlaG (beta-lactamase superfamily)
MRLTWLGHATVVIETAAARIITDPVLRDRMLHLRRHSVSVEPPAGVDMVLISHLHHDHLHLPSLRRFGREVPILVPRGGESLLRSVGGDRVRPVAPGDAVEVAGVTVTVLPATHDGGRGPHSRISGPALGFRVDGGGRSFWFPGDSELRDDMAQVGPVDLALVPIGGWGPTLEDGHMDPVDGAAAVLSVGASVAVPVHWGTFWPLGLRRVAKTNHDRLFTTPGQRFLDALAGQDITALVAEPGVRVTL